MDKILDDSKSRDNSLDVENYVENNTYWYSSECSFYDEEDEWESSEC